MSPSKDTLLQDTLAEIREGEFVEGYIRSLPLHQCTLKEQSLVIGNIRGFFAWLKKQGRVKDASKIVQLLKVDDMILCLDDTGKLWLMMAELDQYGAPTGRFFYTALSIISEPKNKGGN